MNTKEQILQMVKDGDIDINEGVKLLEALGIVNNPTPTNAKSKLRIVVDSADGDKVRINVPTSLLKAGVDIASKLNINGNPVDMKGIDMDMIMQAIEDGSSGEIVDIDTKDGDTVKCKCQSLFSQVR